MSTEPQTITRPNGKPYRARKVTANAWENVHEWGDDSSGVVILGTHDVEAARPFAAEMCAYWFGYDHAVRPRIGWFRDGFVYGERAWIEDAERGRAGIMFSASEYPEGAA